MRAVLSILHLLVTIGLIFVVLFAGNLGGDSSHTTTSNSTFNVGSAKDRADAIERDKTPLLFNDTATGSVPLVVQHTGTDPKTGWSAFAATPDDGSCVLEWNRDQQKFKCGEKTLPPDPGSQFHHYPTRVDGDDLIVDLNPNASSTNS